MNKFYSVVKRFVEFVFSVFLIILTFPLWIIIAFSIKLDGTGGAIFDDSPFRVGKDRKLFRMYKFRTMIPQAHEKLNTDPKYKKLKRSNGEKIPLEEDTRVTKVGKILRRYDLDELPQLINVLNGTMSLIGPRPYFEEEISLHEKNNLENKKKFNKILSIKPGIAGLWLVSGRNKLTLSQRLEKDLEYFDRRSLFTDFKIIVQTLKIVITREGTL